MEFLFPLKRLWQNNLKDFFIGEANSIDLFGFKADKGFW